MRTIRKGCEQDVLVQSVIRFRLRNNVFVEVLYVLSVASHKFRCGCFVFVVINIANFIWT